MTANSEMAGTWDEWLDDRMRGFPTGHDPLPAHAVAGRAWRPQDGRMALPLLSLDLDAFDHNAAVMMGHLADRGALIAPHAKTPMSVTLSRRLLAAGAWGATVADARQASVLLEGGVSRLVLANQVGGRGGADRLAALMGHHPLAELFVFVDSRAGVAALADAWRAEEQRVGVMPSLGLLIELGTDRAGVRSLKEAQALIDGIADLPDDGGVTLAGVATYEGAVSAPDYEQTLRGVDALLKDVADLHQRVRARVGPARPLIVSAGGSVWFDRVLDHLGPLARQGRTRLVLRSGALFFHDDGVYGDAMAAMTARGGHPQGEFRPALRLWAEVLSRPEPDLAIVGLGMRDAASDRGLPVARQLWRDGSAIDGAERLTLVKFNDQHGFVRIDPAGATPEIGDVVEFGISHPCTNLDRHRLIWGLGPDHVVREILPTSFG